MDRRRAGSSCPTGFYPSRRGLSRGKHAVAPLKSRPRGARINTFPEKRARLRIPPPLRGPPTFNKGGRDGGDAARRVVAPYGVDGSAAVDMRRGAVGGQGMVTEEGLERS